MAAEDDNTEDTHLRDSAEAAMLSAYDEQIATLAEKAAAGAAEVDAELAALMDVVPDAIRVEIVRRFQEIHGELHESRGIDQQELTPEMEAQKRLIQEREYRMMAHWLSKETLQKIRRALLLNPALYQQIVTIGMEMAKRGVFYDARRVQITSADIGAVSVQPDLVNAKEKDAGKTR